MHKIFLLFLMILNTGCISGQTKKSDKLKETREDPIQWLSIQVDPEAPDIVLISGDEEYRSEETMPQLAKILSNHHKFNTTVLFPQDPAQPGIINPNYSDNIPGLENLRDADLMIIFTRFRSLPDDQMKYIDEYLKSGKPVIGMRTATHAFQFSPESGSSYAHYSNSSDSIPGWKGGFGRVVLGEKWIAHWGEHGHQSTRGIVNEETSYHPILNGIKSGDIWGPTDVYEVRLPFPEGSKPLVFGQVIERERDYYKDDLLFGMRPSDSIPAQRSVHRYREGEKIIDHTASPMMPIAWIKDYKIPGGKEGKAFTTTMGASTDLLSEGLRRLLVNAVYWSLEQEVPENADVSFVGDFNPGQFGFYTDDFWEGRDLKISDLK